MDKKTPEEMSVEELVEAMDEDAMRIGLTIADLYRTVASAMAALPNMELHTEAICLCVDDQGITVHVGHPIDRSCGDCEGCEGYNDDPYDGDFDDDEEGRIYDEIN